MTKYNLNATETAEVWAQIQQTAHLVFHSPEPFSEAFTHPSYTAEHPEVKYDNQRLEFLGDAVLQIILSEHLFRQFPDCNEGTLTRLRSALVNEQANQGYTKKLGLDAALRLGHGEALNGGRTNPSILGDLFEAFLGAVFLDSGLDSARTLVLRLLPDLRKTHETLQYDENPKGALQQLCLERFKKPVAYTILSSEGPVHAPRYRVQAAVGDTPLGTGAGRSHKEAERVAAADALRTLLNRPEPAPVPEPAPEPKPAPQKHQKLLLALDFDGVICDSAGETAAAAYRAAKQLWPAQCRSPRIPDALTEQFRQIRPYLETGFQAVPMLKALLDGRTPEDFAKNPAALIAGVMEAEHLDKPRLVTLFGETRDRWMTEDLRGWLASHRIYPGTVEALRDALQRHRVFILTTKQERFVTAILRECGIDFPEAAIFGLDRKLSKESVLATFCARRTTNIRFVEDRLETLERVRAIKSLSRVGLFYADWGYGLPDDRAKLAGDRRITPIGLDSFCDLLRS